MYEGGALFCLYCDLYVAVVVIYFVQNAGR